VDDVTQNPAQTVLLVGGRYRFKLLGAPATLRVQVQNATNYYFWGMNYSTGFYQIPPRAYFACLATDFS
jgi:iron complex outermembrane recepter protein